MVVLVVIILEVQGIAAEEVTVMVMSVEVLVMVVMVGQMVTMVVRAAVGTISQKMYNGHKQTLVGIDRRQQPQSVTEQCPIVV